MNLFTTRKIRKAVGKLNHGKTYKDFNLLCIFTIRETNTEDTHCEFTLIHADGTHAWFLNVDKLYSVYKLSVRGERINQIFFKFLRLRKVMTSCCLSPSTSANLRLISEYFSCSSFSSLSINLFLSIIDPSSFDKSIMLLSTVSAAFV